MKRSLKILIFVIIMFVFGTQAFASPGITIDFQTAQDTPGALGALELLFLMVLLSMGPSLMLMVTSFTRIIIVLSFTRNALGTQQSPPNQVLIGLALILSLFVMTPVLNEINETAYEPYMDSAITQDIAIERAIKPVKKFMLHQTHSKDINLFLNIAGQSVEGETEEERLENVNNLGLEIIIPAFITSELKRAFTMGFLIFIPFLIIDIVVGSTLMSMGMMMLPPTMISLPFKIMMFVLVDGWALLMGTLVQSFR